MDWEDWLNSEESQKILRKCAHKIMRKIQTSSLVYLFSNELDSTDEIVSELWLYLKSHAKLWDSKKLLLLLENGERCLILWIVNKFILHLQDKMRSHELSPEAYFYLRLRRVLSSHDGISTAGFRGKTFYCCNNSLPYSPENTYIPEQSDFSSFGFPEDISQENIFDKESIITVAKHFWYEVAKKVSRPVWIPLRNLKDYIKTFIVIPTNIALEEVSNSLKETLKNDDWHTNYILTEKELTIGLTGVNIRSLAETCAIHLDEKEREVLVRLNIEKQTLETVAKAMGYSRASAVAYIRNKAFRKIKEFCIAESLLSPPDLDQEILDEFIENLFDVCKKSF
ncbi:MAG: hypothetical protein WHS38_05805 [Thermodesulforhabdaceae bacterium]